MKGVSSLILLFLLTSCGRLEVSLDRTPTPGLDATMTVAALREENQQLSGQATQVSTLLQPDATRTPRGIPATKADTLGTVYFWMSTSTIDPNDPSRQIESGRIMRLPGSCVAGLMTCPQPEQAQTPFQVFDVSWQPLVWSPDGSVAVLPVAIGENGYPTTVYLYEPQAESWKEVVHFNFVHGAIWSPGGEWVAMQVQDGLGNVDIYAVRPDGSGLRNLTGANFPNKGEPPNNLSMDGWLDKDAIIGIRRPTDKETLFYRVDTATGDVHKLWEYPTYPGGLFPGPDGKLAVVHSLSPRGQVLELLNEEGRVLNTVATFVSGRIYQVVWSRDGKTIGFTVQSEPFTQDSSRVFVVHQDGSGLAEIYRGTLISNLAFSPHFGLNSR